MKPRQDSALKHANVLLCRRRVGGERSSFSGSLFLADQVTSRQDAKHPTTEDVTSVFYSRHPSPVCTLSFRFVALLVSKGLPGLQSSMETVRMSVDEYLMGCAGVGLQLQSLGDTTLTIT